jgi:hypothetical protein
MAMHATSMPTNAHPAAACERRHDCGRFGSIARDVVGSSAGSAVVVIVASEVLVLSEHHADHEGPHP